jgi:glycosyltransferase involved in cell wall biosynthesis
MPRPVRVVVTTFDRPHHLERALAGWLRQRSTAFALTVADDGSGPATAEVIARAARGAPFPIAHVRQDHDGFRKARIANEAVRRAEGEPLLVFADGDCVPPATLVERYVAVATPRVFAVAGVHMLARDVTEALTVDDVARGAHEALATRGSRWEMTRRAWKSRIDLLRRRPRRPKAYGGNLAVGLALFRHVNGFDERFVGWGHEDNDLRDRIMATRPRPDVRILWGRNDAFHLWHPPAADRDAGRNDAYYRTPGRPIRCLAGLEPARD